LAISAIDATSSALSQISEEFTFMNLKLKIQYLPENEKKQILWDLGISRMLYATYLNQPQLVESAIEDSHARYSKDETYHGLPLFWISIYLEQRVF